MLLVAVARPIGAQGHFIWPWDQLPGSGQPVVLVHGGNADASTWTSFASTLSQNGYFTMAPNLVAGDPITSQADAVKWTTDQNGFRGPDVMFAAHSQGGLVSRVVSRTQPVRTLVTIGTPHQGMPFAANHWKITNQLTYVAIDVGLISLLNFPRSGPDYYDGWNYWEYNNWMDRFVALRYGLRGAGLIFAGLNIYQNHIWGSKASWDELSPGSGFLQELNANVGSERVEHAYSIMADVGTGYYGGPLRLLFSGPTSDQLGEQMFYIGTVLEDIGYSMLSNIWYSDNWFFDFLGAVGALDLGYRLETFGDWWTFDVVAGYPNDGLVPTGSQYRPGSVPVQLRNTSHTEETGASFEAQLQMKALLDSHRP